MIIIFPGHNLARCTDPGCIDNCSLCAGLSLCTVCGGAEGSLPTDCPGERMWEEVEEEVYAGEVDYKRDRGWVREPNYLRSRHYKG